MLTLRSLVHDASTLHGRLPLFTAPSRTTSRPAFLEELRLVAVSCVGPFLVCGDFNLIYQVADKNNDRLNLRSMRSFRCTLDAMHVDELYLHGKLFTWSSKRRRPTLERLDRAFGNVQ